MTTPELAALRAMCLAFPEAEEKEAWGSPTFRVNGRMFAQCTNSQPGLAVTFPAAAGEQAVLVEVAPEQYFVPPYTGPKGWAGARLGNATDWEQLARLLLDAYRRVAPKRMAATLDRPELSPRALAKLAAAAQPDPAEVAAARAFAARSEELRRRLREVCLALPAAEERAGNHASFQVKGKTFAYFLNNHHNDGRLALACKTPPGAREMLLDSGSGQFFIPPYLGAQGWLGVDLDDEASWAIVPVLVRDSYRLVAPKRLLAALPRD